MVVSQENRVVFPSRVVTIPGDLFKRLGDVGKRLEEIEGELREILSDGELLEYLDYTRVREDLSQAVERIESARSKVKRFLDIVVKLR